MNKSRKTRKLNLASIVILLIAVVFIVIGALRGEASDIYNKATEICLSCMGIAK